MSYNTRYEVGNHINDERKKFRVWDNSLQIFITNPQSFIETSHICDKMNDEETLYMKALFEYFHDS